MKLHIEKLIYGGLGLSHTGNGIVFVEQVIPGETVEAEIIGEKSHTPVAYPKKILEKSPFRRTPPCKYYGVCGGCNFQYLEYSQQLKHKKEIFIESLQRIGKIDTIPKIDIYESPEWEYRIRAQMKVDIERNVIGFYREKSNDVVHIEKCPLLDSKLNSIFQNSTSIISNLPHRIKQVKLIAGNNQTASFPVIPDITEKHTEICVSDKIFTVNGGSFFQGNKFLLEKMGTWAKPYIKGHSFIDMYGGLGFFSIMLGNNFSQGLLIENITSQTEQANKNFRKNNITHIKAKTASAEEFLSQKNLPETDLLIIDPPRPGMTRKVREGVRDLSPGSILYISCNPSTQARDVGFFSKECGYSIDKAVLFDLYPQTHHIETALLLFRS